MKAIDITKEQFQSYRRVQKEGRFNMFDENARLLTGLDKKTYIGIMQHYAELMVIYEGETDG